MPVGLSKKDEKYSGQSSNNFGDTVVSSMYFICEPLFISTTTILLLF